MREAKATREAKALGARIRALREKRNLRQADLAPVARATASEVSRWERGVSEPTLRQLRRVAKRLGVGVGDVLGITGESVAQAQS